MGGIHTNIEGATELNGFWTAGDAVCNSTHDANCLGANSSAECLVWGEITGEHTPNHALTYTDLNESSRSEQISEEEKRIFDGIFRGRGEANHYVVRKHLTDIMDDKTYVFRTKNSLMERFKELRFLKSQTWKHVDDRALEYNTDFINVMETDSMLSIAEIVLVNALNRCKSRGAHAR